MKTSKTNLLDKMYTDLQEMLSIESDSKEMELIYTIVALELTIEKEKNNKKVSNILKSLEMYYTGKDSSKKELEVINKVLIDFSEYLLLKVKSKLIDNKTHYISLKTGKVLKRSRTNLKELGIV